MFTYEWREEVGKWELKEDTAHRGFFDTLIELKAFCEGTFGARAFSVGIHSHSSE